PHDSPVLPGVGGGFAGGRAWAAGVRGIGWADAPIRVPRCRACAASLVREAGAALRRDGWTGPRAAPCQGPVPATGPHRAGASRPAGRRRPDQVALPRCNTLLQSDVNACSLVT